VPVEGQPRILRTPEDWKARFTCGYDGKWTTPYNTSIELCVDLPAYFWNYGSLTNPEGWDECRDYTSSATVGTDGDVRPLYWSTRSGVQYRRVWCAADVSGRESFAVDPSLCLALGRKKPTTTRECQVQEMDFRP